MNSYYRPLRFEVIFLTQHCSGVGCLIHFPKHCLPRSHSVLAPGGEEACYEGQGTGTSQVWVLLYSSWWGALEPVTSRLWAHVLIGVVGATMPISPGCWKD